MVLILTLQRKTLLPNIKLMSYSLSLCILYWYCYNNSPIQMLTVLMMINEFNKVSSLTVTIGGQQSK